MASAPLFGVAFVLEGVHPALIYFRQHRHRDLSEVDEVVNCVKSVLGDAVETSCSVSTSVSSVVCNKVIYGTWL